MARRRIVGARLWGIVTKKSERSGSPKDGLKNNASCFLVDRIYAPPLVSARMRRSSILCIQQSTEYRILSVGDWMRKQGPCRHSGVVRHRQEMAMLHAGLCQTHID